MQKATLRSVMSACPSERLSAWNNSAHTGRILLKFNIWVFFRKSVEKILVSVKYYKKTGTLHEDKHTFMSISCSVLLRMSNISNKICRENKKTHFIFNKFYFNKKSCRLWHNVEKYCTAGEATGDIVAHAHFTLGNWSYKHTLSEYVILTAFPLQQWLQERASILRCTYIVRLVYLSCFPPYDHHISIYEDCKLYSPHY